MRGGGERRTLRSWVRGGRDRSEVHARGLAVITGDTHRGPAEGGGLSLFAEDPPTTAETLAEDAGEVDFWRELGALLHPAGILYVLCRFVERTLGFRNR